MPFGPPGARRAADVRAVPLRRPRDRSRRHVRGGAERAPSAIGEELVAAGTGDAHADVARRLRRMGRAHRAEDRDRASRHRSAPHAYRTGRVASDGSLSFAMVVEGMVMSGVNRVAALRADDVVNRLVTVDYAGTGGALDDQWYQEGCFALDDDEVLVLETPLDPECRAFSLALTDTFFSTIDWANAQSSLNRRQAVVDPRRRPAGRRRVARDPGVHNWLDTTGSSVRRAAVPLVGHEVGARLRGADRRCPRARPTRSRPGSAHDARATRRRDPRPADRRAAATRTGRCRATWGSRRRRRPR